VTVDLQTRLGVKVDYAAVDWGTVVARRAQKKPARPGRLADVPHQSCADCIDPTNKLIRADGSLSTNGCPRWRLIAKSDPEGRQVARSACCSAFSSAVDRGLRLDRMLAGRPWHEIDVPYVGVALMLALLVIGYVVTPPVVIRQAAALWGLS
jgi:hypothetical protein